MQIRGTGKRLSMAIFWSRNAAAWRTTGNNGMWLMPIQKGKRKKITFLVAFFDSSCIDAYASLQENTEPKSLDVG